MRSPEASKWLAMSDQAYRVGRIALAISVLGGLAALVVCVVTHTTSAAPPLAMLGGVALSTLLTMAGRLLSGAAWEAEERHRGMYIPRCLR